MSKDGCQNEYVVFKDVPGDTLQQLDSDSSRLYHCRYLYIHDTKALRITITSAGADEIAVAEFTRFLFKETFEMQVGYELSCGGSSPLCLENITKKPYGCWGSENQDYLTFTLEAGLFTSRKRKRKLELDARLWIESPESEDSHVRQVITILIASDGPEITFQKWETASDQPRRALMTEEVDVYLVNNVPAATGSLSLSFEKIFERPPRPNTAERDLIFKGEDLTTVAWKIWRRQKLIPREMARKPPSSITEGSGNSG